MATGVDKFRRPTLDELNHVLEFNPDKKEPGRVEIVEVDNPAALNPAGEGVYVYKRFTMTPIGLEMPPDTTEAEWLDIGRVIRNLETSISWVIGDWAYYAHAEWETPYEAIAEAFGYEVETLYTYGTIIRAFPTSIRNRGASFGHHRAVVKLPPAEQQKWLERAAAKNWTISQMKAAIWPKLPPAVSSPRAYDHLFSRENKPNINSVQKHFMKAGQGDIKAREKALKALDDLARWVDEARRSL